MTSGTLRGTLAVALSLVAPGPGSGASARAGELQEESVQVPDLRVVGWQVDDALGGNGDFGLHPGETARLSVTLSNRGNQTARGVAGQLFEDGDHPDVEILDKLAVWPDLPATGLPGASDLPHFEIRVATTRPCAWRIPLRLVLTADGGYEQTEHFVLEMVDPPVIDLAASKGRPVVYGATSGDALGRDIATGDLDGDGFDDMVLGVELGDGPANGRLDAGEVVILYGGLTTPVDADLVALPPGAATVYGDDIGDRLGLAVATGDLDGDGFDDLVLGARFGDGPADTLSNAGEVAVIYGGPTRLTTVDLAAPPTGVAIIYGADAFDNAGGSVTTGDLDGDGFDDLVLGARGGDGPGDARSSAGDVVVLYGAPTRLANIDLASAPPGAYYVYGADALDFLGTQVAAGDLDGDGFDDLALGATGGSGPDNERTDAGEMRVIYGDATRPDDIDLAAPPPGVAVIHGARSFDQMPASAATGDLDGDGFDDLALGVVDDDGPSGTRTFAGGVVLIPGGPTRLTALDLASPPEGVTTVFGRDADDFLGADVAVADLDGDGFEDVAIGSRGSDGPNNSRSNAGEVTIVHGGPTLPTNIDLASSPPGVATIYGTDTGDELGTSVTAGDLDGDGLADLVAAAPLADGPPTAVRVAAGEVAMVPGAPRSRYRLDLAASAFIDATAGVNLGLGCDDCSTTIPIGFPFDWYGETQTEVTVSSNGYLTFGGLGDRLPAFCPPRSSPPNNLIAPYWEDLDPSAGGGVFALLEGTEPNRRLTIEWAGVPLYGGIGAGTFEVTLFETSDQILMQYQDVLFGSSADNGGTAIIALENATGRNSTRWSCFNPSSVINGTALQARRFASPTVVYGENVESGLNGWTATGLWHTVTSPTCSPSARSGGSSFYYGQNATCNYNTGAINAGNLTSPLIEGLPQDAELSFWQRRQVEGDANFDLSLVQAQGNGGGFTTRSQVLEFSNAWRSSLDFLPLWSFTGHLSVVDLSAYAGQDTELRFRFDTVDSAANAFLGWMVDDITVTACPVFDEVSMTSTAVSSLAVATAQPPAICETAMGRVDAAGSYCSGCGSGLSYQWSRDGAPIAGATGTVYDIPAGQPLGSRQFTVAIDCAANPACADLSEPAAVSVVQEPAGVGATLTVEPSGPGLEFHWDDVAGADAYVLYSSPTPDGAFDMVAGTAGSGTTGVTTPMPPGARVFYLVAGRNDTCGEGELRSE